MGLLSRSMSLSRYRVQGRLEGAAIETVAAALKKNAIGEIDDESMDKAVGWSSFAHPYRPDFDADGFSFGSLWVFCLRIDKKVIPSRVVRKHYEAELARRRAQTDGGFLSRQDKQAVRDHVVNLLSIRIPATPSVHDVVWNYEAGRVWYFSLQKSANEELESWFHRSFGLRLIRLFPYTAAELTCELSDVEKDALSRLTPSPFIA